MDISELKFINVREYIDALEKENAELKIKLGDYKQMNDRVAILKKEIARLKPLLEELKALVQDVY